MSCFRQPASITQETAQWNRKATSKPSETRTLLDLPSMHATLPAIVYATQSTITMTIVPSPTTTRFPSSSFAYVEAKQTVSIPILMYHHITNADPGERYNTTIAEFRDQMEVLSENGFATITTLELANVLRDGGYLPSRPVVITFDDGNQDVYDNAFPILDEMGFRAVVYVVANRLDIDGFLCTDQLKELLAAGWEVGSHSMTHANLADAPRGLNEELYQSRILLGNALSTDVLTFAYPYTFADSQIFQKAYSCGYRAAVCGGLTNTQSMNNLYCLHRREVKGGIQLAEFKELLGIQ